MSKKQISNINVVASTKGGVGKSNLATQILPFLLFSDTKNENKKMKIYEIDDNNISRIDFVDEKIERASFKVNEANSVLENLSEEIFDNDDVISIIDSGGGNDTKAVLKHLKANYLVGCNYYIPILGGEDIQNAKDTIDEIKSLDKNSKIILVLNRITSLDKNDIKTEFWNVFGDENIGEANHLETLEYDDMILIPNLTIFAKLSKQRASLLDVVNKTKEMIPNIMDLRRGWKKISDEESKKNFGLFKFGEECVAGANLILNFNSQIKG